MKKLITLSLVLLPFFLYSQVQLVSSDVTKIYLDDTHITYMHLSDFPIDSDFLQFVEKEVLSNTLIQRFKLGEDGETCFFHSHKDITDDMIVEAINDAYQNYYSQLRDNQHSIVKKNVVRKESYFPNGNKVEPVNLEKSFSVRSFKKSDHNGQYYKVAFKLENTLNLDNIKKSVIVLKEQGNFEKIDIVENVYFEISSYEPISADLVIGIFEKFGLTIDDEYILDRF
jgi:hypothetical protein